MFLPAAIATISNLSLCSLTMSRVCVPMLPVLPNKLNFCTCKLKHSVRLHKAGCWVCFWHSIDLYILRLKKQDYIPWLALWACSWGLSRPCQAKQVAQYVCLLHCFHSGQQQTP